MVYTLKFIVCEYPGEWLSWVSHPGFDPECQYLIHQRMKLVHHPSPMMTQSTSCLETEGKGPVRCSGKKDKKTRQIGIFLFTRLGYTSSWGYSSVVQSLRNKNKVLNLLLGRMGAGQTEGPHLKDLHVNTYSAFPRLGQQDGEPTTFSSGHKTLL